MARREAVNEKAGKKKRRGASGSGGGSSTRREDAEPAASGPAVEGAAPPDAAGARTFYDSFRENVESLLIAIILAIVIRHFAVEAFEIPTGSMAPTLFGMHVVAECPNCAEEYAVAVSSDASSGRFRER